jgi:hypothetical protein
MANCRSGGPEKDAEVGDAMIGWIGVVLHHLQSLLSVVEQTILCAFVCKVGHFDAQIRERILYE